MNVYSILKTSSLGDLLLVANPAQLVGVYFSDCSHTPATRDEWRLDPRHDVLRQAGTQILDFLNGARREFSLPLHLAGTDLQRRVWQEIAQIPFGQTITYSELAGRAGSPSAIRAVGTATGRNPLSIIIPCHRVLGKDGSLHGYAGGLPRKQRLLELEQGSPI